MEYEDLETGDKATHFNVSYDAFKGDAELSPFKFRTEPNISNRLSLTSWMIIAIAVMGLGLVILYPTVHSVKLLHLGESDTSSR